MYRVSIDQVKYLCGSIVFRHPTLKKRVWWNCIQKVFGQEFWLDDIYKLCKCYANIDSANTCLKQ